MIVCLCHRVSDRDIAREVGSGCPSFDALQERTRVGTGCGACLECAHDTWLAMSGPVSGGAASARNSPVAAARSRPAAA